MVNLRGIDDEEDIAHLMIEGGLAKARADRLIDNKNDAIKEEKKVPQSASKHHPFSTSNNVVSATINIVPVAKTTVLVAKTEPKEDLVSKLTKVKPVTDPTKIKPASEPTMAKPAVPAGLKISRGVLPVNDTTVVGVCLLETPDTFYVCPSSCIEQFVRGLW